MPTQEIKSRIVFNFQGFEASDSERLMGRVLHCAEKTSQLWGFEIKQRSCSHHKETHFSECELAVHGKDWTVDSKIVQLSFGDIVTPYLEGSFIPNLLQNLGKFIAFFFDGSIFSYFRASKLYGAFILFPIIYLAAISALSYFVASALIGSLGLGGLLEGAAKALTFIALFLLLCRWPGKRILFLLTLGHWGYARDMALASNSVLEERYGIFTDTICKELSDVKFDEIIFAGHSFGAVWAPIVLARVLEARPDLLEGQRIAIMSMGGSLLNTALVPKAKFFRDKIAKLAGMKNLFWHDYQCKDDPICFYKSDMFEVLEIEKPEGGYQISRVNFKHSMQLPRYRKMKKSIYDTHRQYGLYQDKCISFDYFIRLLGPVSVERLAKEPSTAQLVADEKEVVLHQGVIVHKPN